MDVRSASRAGIALLLMACRIEGTEPGDCVDRADNDADGSFDCADGGCAGSPDCVGDTGSVEDSGTTELETDPGYVRMPATTFEMGCAGECGDNEELHTVTLTHDYFVGITEVTEDEFAGMMGYPLSIETCAEAGGDCPISYISWNEAAAYTNALSTASGREECYDCAGRWDDVVCEVHGDPYTCEGYRLLTEAEWEAAARCGTTYDFAGSDVADDVAWYDENSDGTPHPVGQLAPNDCGLFDMSGNAWEMTQDWYDYYGSAPVTDPTGGSSGYCRVQRGGSYFSSVQYSRVASRGCVGQEDVYSNIAFRVGRTAL